MDLQHIFMNFTKGKFEGTDPHTEKLKEWHEAYKKALKAKGGCPACKRRRINANYKSKIRELLAADIE